MISSKYTIREQNEANILNYIIKNKKISRASLSEISALNKASVSSITKKLIDEHLIHEVGTGEASTLGGRKPILLTFNKKTALLIAIDLGFNYVDAILTYVDGSEVGRVQRKNLLVTSENIQTIIDEIVVQFEANLPKTPHEIVGMTIGIQGQVFKNKLIFTPYYDLSNIDLYDILNSKYSFPIYIENEANLSALGEYTFSSDFESLISISLHRGIGAGIVKRGRLEVGNNGNAGEIGHMILFPEGRQCPCGNRGCFDQYCSTKKIYDETKEIKNLDIVNSEIMKDLYDSNDEEVRLLVQKYASLLAVGVNNVIMMYAPQLVIFNSALTKKIPYMITLINEHLTNRFSKNIKIINSPIEWNPVLYGGVACAAQHFLNIEELKLIELE